MWRLYRDTFVGIQVVIAVVTGSVFFATGHRLPAALVFFVAMQIGAVLGAMWGVRFRSGPTAHRPLPRAADR